MLIRGDYIQDGGIFNIASGAGNTTTVKIGGNLFQSPAGQITETNTGLPAIELNGTTQQTVGLEGTISNSVCLRINNPGGVLLTSALRLPFRLECLHGTVFSSAHNMLILQKDCSVFVDSTVANHSYVEGPLRKEGLAGTAYFLFPVGKQSLRWLELKNASGDFVVEFIRSNPSSLSSAYETGIDHISSHEYWTIVPDPGNSAMAEVELSFAIPASGLVTDLPGLRVAGLSGGTWKNFGNRFASGNLAVSGSVVSETIHDFSGTGAFALASDSRFQSPLPLRLVDLTGSCVNEITRLSWMVDFPGEADYFEVPQQQDNGFTTIGMVPALPELRQYRFDYLSRRPGINYYRLRVVEKSGPGWVTDALAIRNPGGKEYAIVLAPSVLERSVLRCHITAPENGSCAWMIVSAAGKILRRGGVELFAGSNWQEMDVGNLPAGVYYFIGLVEKEKPMVARFVRL